METSELRKSITDMTDEDCRDYIAHLRKLRRTPPKKKTVVSKKKEKSTEELISQIPSDAREALLKKLQGG